MHPFLAQGACQAMEDAAVLAAVLGKRGEGAVPSALNEYERLRFDRATRVQNQARTHEHLWHMSDPREITERNKVLASTMDLDPFAETVWGWLFRYDAEQRAAVGAEEPWLVMQRPESQRAWKQWATMLKPADLDRQQHGLRDAYDRFLLENFPAEAGTTIRRGDVDGVPYVDVTAGDQSQGPVVLHMHGGGYMIGSADASVGSCPGSPRQ
jgi:salicylate hydroxylase